MLPQLRAFARCLPALLCIVVGSTADAQTTIFYQGFENAAVACTGENWPYTGGNRNTETARTGSWSLRVGRQSESTTATFQPRNVSGLENVQLQVYHRVRPGMGPGLDTQEGAVMLVQLNGGAWTPIARVGGYADHNYPWTSAIGGSATVSVGCNVYQAPNPVVYNVPAGTNLIAFRVLSVSAGNCTTFNSRMNSGATGYSYDRPDEGFFIDDLRLTTTTTPLPGIWTGAVSVDWFDCRNWNLGYVPAATTPVTIQQTAVRNCTVGQTGPGNAVCASLMLRTNNATNRNLTVQNSSVLAIGGPLDIQRNAANTDSLVATVTGGSTLSATGVSISGTTAAAFEAILRCETPGNLLMVETDLTIGPGALLDMESGGLSGGRLELGGDFINLRDESHFQEVNSTVALVGNGPQSISITTGSEVFYRLEVQKTGGDVTLASPVEVSSVLDLQSGRVFTTAAELLSLRAGSAALNASDAAFVHGPMQKIGTTNFTFPVGKGTSLRPCGVSAIVGGATDAFTAEYFPESAREAPFANVMEPTLDHVSDCEYWMIERSSGTPNAVVSLTWDTPESCGVTSLPDLRVAYWDVAIWRNRGNNVAVGDNTSGTIPTDVAQSLFGAFTLASNNWTNPLPISLVDFTARPEGVRVRLEWTTASEENNDFFTVERSADGISFSDLFHVPGAGTSHALLKYLAYDDRPLSGISYYRLRQTDHDGTNTVSPMVAVRFESAGALTVWPVDGTLQVHHPLPADAVLELYDAAGRLLLSQRAGAEGLVVLMPGTHAPGVYLLRAMHGERVLVARFFR